MRELTENRPEARLASWLESSVLSSQEASRELPESPYFRGMNVPPRNRFAFWVLLVVAIFFFGLGLSGVVYFIAEVLAPTSMPQSVSVGVLLSNLASAAAVFSVVVPIYLGPRYVWPVYRDSENNPAQLNARPTWKHYALISVLTVLTDLLYSSVLGYFYWAQLSDSDMQHANAHYNFFYLISPVAAACVFYYWLTRERDQTARFWVQEAQMLKLNELKTKAELEALQAKINPHFLYNALNSIASLVHLDPDKAEQMTLLLSKFFRYSTAGNSEYDDTVSHELDLVSTYLDVEKVRFDERLQYAIHLQNDALREYRIPRFLLQPLVENAIKHGISKRASDGLIRLEISQEDAQLVIRLYDNGPPFPEAMTSGYGLQSIRDKLRLLGGPDATLHLINTPEKHVRLVLSQDAGRSRGTSSV